MIVIDTNIIVYLFVPGEYTHISEQVYKKDPHWVVPVLWKSEFRNVISLYVRQKNLNLETALKITQKAEGLLLDCEYVLPSEDILSLANQSKCSAYDCEFVCLARKLNSKLVTMDKQLKKYFPSIVILAGDYIRK